MFDNGFSNFFDSAVEGIVTHSCGKWHDMSITIGVCTIIECNFEVLIKLFSIGTDSWNAFTGSSENSAIFINGPGDLAR